MLIPGGVDSQFIYFKALEPRIEWGESLIPVILRGESCSLLPRPLWERSAFGFLPMGGSVIGKPHKEGGGKEKAVNVKDGGGPRPCA
jgi:hypothetical protein